MVVELNVAELGEAKKLGVHVPEVIFAADTFPDTDKELVD